MLKILLNVCGYWQNAIFFNMPTEKKPQLSIQHSMAKDNFNKSKETTPTTSAAL